MKTTWLKPLAIALGALMLNIAAGQVIVAHRGASYDAPENTLAAFRLAWEQGADAVEGDFYLTSDQQIVCIHDKDTKRTGGQKLVVAESTLEQLLQLDVGCWKGDQFTGERIPTLAQVLATVPEGKQIFIEIKCGPEIVPVLRQELQVSPLTRDQIRIIAFNRDVIAAAKQAMPTVKSYWLTSYKEDRGDWQPALEQVLETLKQVQADGLDSQANLDVVNEAWVQQLQSAGFETHYWTVNDLEIAWRLRSLGAHSITTDRPAYLRQGLTLDAAGNAESPVGHAAGGSP